MCFHVATPTREELLKVFPAEIKILDYQPLFHANGYSHNNLPVMTSQEPHLVQPMTWGLVPHWTRSVGEAHENRNKTLNARAETMFTTPMFKNYAPHRRCLIFVTGFYEWKHVKKEKIPYFIYTPNKQPFALGGIYANWQHQDWPHTAGASIVTTEANGLMAEIHNTKLRMPLIVPEQNWSAWLDTSLHPDEVKAIAQPYPEGQLAAHSLRPFLNLDETIRNSPAVQERYDWPNNELF